MKWAENIRAALSSWRKYQEGLRTLRNMAEQKPAAAAFAFEIAAEALQREALQDVYYFGVASPQAQYIQRLGKLEDPEAGAEREALFYETYYHDREKYEELAAQGVFDPPKEKKELLREGPSLNLDEELRSTLAAMQYTTYKMARHKMSIVGEKSHAAGQGHYGPAVCEAFLETCEQFPIIFAGVVQEKWGGDPRIRRGAAASLTGWVASRIRLYPRLKAALEGVQGSSAFEQLVQGLAGAVVIEWATLEREEPLRVLVSRTALRLVKEGDQTGRLNREGKLATAKPGEEVGADEPDLEEFRMREDLRVLKESAKLSEQQYQILELSLEDQPNYAIAEKLNLTVDAVKSAKKLARKNLRRAAGQ